jgi:hypothetical protein
MTADAWQAALKVVPAVVGGDEDREREGRSRRVTEIAGHPGTHSKKIGGWYGQVGLKREGVGLG